MEGRFEVQLNMSPDGPDSATVLPSSQRVLSIPRTALSRWSMWLLAASVVLFGLFVAMSETARAAGVPLNRYWFVGAPLLFAVVSAAAAGVVALVAIFRRGERSGLMLLPLLAAAVGLLLTIGFMTAGTNPCKEVKGPCVITTAP